MIQTPTPVGMARGSRAALVVAALAVAIPVFALLGRSEPAPNAAGGSARALASDGSPALTPELGGSTGGAADAPQFDQAPAGFAGNRLVIGLSPGPIAVAAGFGHVWVASGGDDAVRRFDSDGAIDRPAARLTATRSGAPARPVIGLAERSVWVAGVPGRRDLVEIDSSSAAPIHRFTLAAPAVGICGGLGAAWIVTTDHRLLRLSAGRVAQVLGPSQDDLHIAIGARLVWLSRGHEITAIQPTDGKVVHRYRGGGGPIAVDGGSVWAVSQFGEAFELVRIDEASGTVVDRAQVSTSGYSGIAWALPTIRAAQYGDTVSTVAPRSTISAIVGDVTWVGRPTEGELWRIDRSRAVAPGAAPVGP